MSRDVAGRTVADETVTTVDGRVTVAPRVFPAAALRIAQQLQAAGYDTVLVGGSVRDVLRGSAPKDVDLATRATPDEVKRRFARAFVVGAGERHGTIGVMGADDVGYEVTTFREDVETDGRHASVRFAQRLEDDLGRRDFTVNAMALRPVSAGDTGELTLELVDPWGGLDDLRAGVLRTVGPAAERFREDWLRILRLYRFAARLGATPVAEARAAARERAGMLTDLSRERVHDEIWKTLGDTRSPGALAHAWRLLREDGVLHAVLPELAPPLPPADREGTPDPFGTAVQSADVLGTVAEASGVALDGEQRALLRLVLLLAQVPAEAVGRLLDRLLVPTRVRAHVTELLALLPAARTMAHAGAAGPDLAAFRRHRAAVRRSDDTDLPVLVAAEAAGQAMAGRREGAGDPRADAVRAGVATGRTLQQLWGQAEAARWPRTLGDLALDGTAVATELGVRPGPVVGQTLQQLHEAVLAEPERNTAEGLRQLLATLRTARAAEPMTARAGRPTGPRR